MADQFNPKEWITTAEAAEITGYTSRNIVKVINKGRLRGVKRGGLWFLRREEAQAYAREMRQLGRRKHDPWRGGSRQREDSEEA